MALMYVSGDGLPNLEDVQDRVQLVDLLDGASDAACVAILRRLDALPVPCRATASVRRACQERGGTTKRSPGE